MIRCRIFLSFIGIEILALAAFLVLGVIQSIDVDSRLQYCRDIARQLTLTDLSIWTEARYTRHPSQTDFFSPFQDFPGSPDHFPAGSVLTPPVFSSNINAEASR